MKRVFNIAMIVGILAVIIIQLALNKTEAANRIYYYDKEAPVHVFGDVLKRDVYRQEKSYSGLFESVEEVKISADIQGRVVNIFVEEGEKVSKGQVLVKVDDELFKLQLGVLMTKLEGLKKDEHRYLTLSKEDAVPGIKLEKVQNAIAAIEAEKNLILEKMSKSVVRAPFDGVLSMKFCEVGSFASPAVPLFEIINESDLKFVIQVPEEDLTFFSENQDYVIEANTLAGVLPAELNYIGSKGTKGNSFKVEFAIDAKDVKPKMIGELKFLSKIEGRNVIKVPSRAILGSESNPEIYKVSLGKATRIPISILSRGKDYLSVTGSLNFGDTVITGGFVGLFDGANVIVQQ